MSYSGRYASKEILKTLRSHRVPIKTEGKHTHKGWIQVDCPYCGPRSEKYHLGFNMRASYFNCWRCGAHPFLRTMALILHVEIPAVKDYLGDTVVEFREWDTLFEKPTHYQEPKGVELLFPGDNRFAHYLTKRGFDESQITWLANRHRVGTIGMTPKLQWRLFMPIMIDGRPMSWTTRSIHPKATMRYVSAAPEQEACSHKKLLYGEDACVGNTIILTEGPIDAWAIGSGAAATMGLSYTRAQLNRMRFYPRRIICFDNSEAAQLRAGKLADELAAFDGETWTTQLLSGEDPADADKQEIQELRDWAFAA